MYKIILLVAAVLTTILTTSALAADYNYVSPDQFKQWLESGKTMSIVDIQVPPEFAKKHFNGAIETNAYPVKSPEEKQRLDKSLPILAAGEQDVVVICPRGGGGAKNTVDYLKEKGITEKRIIILKEGMQGWPYKEMTVGEQK